MLIGDHLAEALAGTQAIALVGDEMRDALYSRAVEWGFQLSSLDARELATFGEGHRLWGLKSRAHYLLVIENAEAVSGELEEVLLDMMFDGCHALPDNTLIAVHFASETNLSQALDDEAVPVSFLKNPEDLLPVEEKPLPLAA
ncbi:hypothetical protein [Erythrobacter aureus]|uniref:Uncharacterized protein n=1 Tax=Erythrobacter aureus TaxID=2182384 RepID=A0A345YJ64_9SPHN|nr:hypothetical protein [Erythrobacter aureus]AXK43966.1 hypothetical protein DVR09_16050 [Erythrobacter aureus]